MASTYGFQSNSTIHAAFWRYKPDLSLEPTGSEVYIELNNIQRIEATNSHDKVWIYYAATSTAVAEPVILSGTVAHAFMTSLEGLFP